MVCRLKDSLLIVGDEASDRTILREIFSSSFNLIKADNLPQATLLLEQNDACIAAVLVDLQQIDDEDVKAVNQAAHWGSDTEIPIISLIDAAATPAREELAFSRGASDVIRKPYTPASIRRRIQVLTDLHLHKWHLQKLVTDQGTAIRNSNQIMVEALSAIIEHRNAESGNHILRIRRFTKILLEDVAQNCPEYDLTPDTIDVIANASALHDIGKISIPDSILSKPGKLTAEEYEVMKAHTTVGGELIQNLSGMGDTEYLRYAYNICLYHHERWDGGGYPFGLSGEDIPICAQVAGISDVFDALTSPRAYKPALPCDTAINMIVNGECGVFSPKLLECFKHVRTQFVSLAHHYADGYSPKDDAITVPLPGPAWKPHSLSTSQLSLVKYQTLLHYIDHTVLELDLDAGLYHVVYNPNPDLDSIMPNASFTDISDILVHVNLHPEDAGIQEEIRQFISETFFSRNLRRHSFRCRIFSPVTNAYRPYELTLLRVNTGNDEQRIVIAMWHPLPQNGASRDTQTENLYSSPALQGLISCALRCRSDEGLPIDAGASTLYTLTGYTQEEILAEFGGKLLNMVDPRDRELFSSAMQQHLLQGGRAETEYRILRKNKDPLWVLDKSRVAIEADGCEYFYHAIRDNARVKAVEHELKASSERNQLIIDQSGGIVFEWELGSDTMYISPKWEEHFGYAPVSKNYSKQLGIGTHFHPDDMPLIFNTVNQIMEHSFIDSIDVRIINSEAKYLWTKVVAAGRYDEQDRLTHIVGFLQDIDAAKRAMLDLKKQAEYDSLTKLLNKSSAQQLISEYLAHRDPESMAAILILDLDNFKAVNDHFGHLYGDELLSKTASHLQKFFRNRDIVGRIGGDEFIILLRDIPNEQLIHDRCRLLLETFRSLLEEYAPGHQVSCSIGAALVPAHGLSYSDLFHRADGALYLSKAQGKNTYTIYDPQQIVPASANINARVPTRIDSDKQPGMADASFVRFVFRKLYESSNIISTINEILAYVGELLNVSRVYIFENNEDNTTCSNTFEWCNEGIAPEMENLQEVSYITDVAGWPDVFNEHGVFYCADISSLKPHFRAILEPQGIKSMLQCSILENGVFRGYIGFDECSIHRLWSQEQIELLQFLSEVLSLFLLKKRFQDRNAAQASNLQNILDNQESLIYVIDPKTYELKFLNKKVRSLSPSSQLGMTCYQAFMDRDTPCETCPLRTPSHSCVIESHRLGTRMRAESARILWNDRASELIICHDLSQQDH